MEMNRFLVDLAGLRSALRGAPNVLRVCSIHTHLRQLYCAVLANGAFCWLAAENPLSAKNADRAHPFLILLCGFYSFSRSSNSVFDISRYSAERPRASTHTRVEHCPLQSSSTASKRIDMPQPARYRARGRNHGRVRRARLQRAASDAIAACVDSNAITLVCVTRRTLAPA